MGTRESMKTTIELRACIDVDNLEKGIEFYTQALGLSLGRRLDAAWAELLGAPIPLDLLANPQGSRASVDSAAVRDYGRHWTPVHFDFVVAALDSAVPPPRTPCRQLYGHSKEKTLRPLP